MLDLSKPYAIDGVTIFGDLEQSDLFYYLPNEVGLNFSTDNEPELAFQIFYPDEALQTADSSALDKSVGAILSLGVHCKGPEDLDSLKSKLASQTGVVPRLTVAPWEDGNVQLMVLDAMSGDTQAAPSDDMVTGIVGSRKPTLQDANLNAIFQAKLDRRGAALTLAAIAGETSTIAGVLYDMTFSALRPAANMRMRADLTRVAEAFSFGVGVKIYYVGADVTATFQKLREQGIIQVDLVSEVADPQEEKLINDAVNDFYDSLMRELFSPVIPAMTPQIAAGAQTSIVQLKFSYSRTEQERIIEVDYRKRSATLRTHNPQAHLGSLAKLAGGASKVVQRVKLSEAWREFRVEVAAPQAFNDPTLREIRVILWRGQDAVLTPEAAVDGGLRMPQNVTPLGDFALNTTNSQAKQLVWVSMPDEATFYHWQARLIFGPDENIDSPAQIWTEPAKSSSANLDIYPDILAPKKKVSVQLGVGWTTFAPEVDIEIVAVDNASKTIAQQILRVTPQTPATSWAIRRGIQTLLTLMAARTILFPDGSRVSQPAKTVLDSQLLINSPFIRPVTITPLVVGIPDDLVQISLILSYQDEPSGYSTTSSTMLRAPAFSSSDIQVPVLNPGDRVTWQAIAVRSTGTPKTVGSGKTTGGVITIAPIGAVRRIHVEWIGGSPDDLGLRWLRTTVRNRTDNGDIGESHVIEFNQNNSASPQDVVMPNEGVI